MYFRQGWPSQLTVGDKKVEVNSSSTPSNTGRSPLIGAIQWGGGPLVGEVYWVPMQTKCPSSR